MYLLPRRLLVPLLALLPLTPLVAQEAPVPTAFTIQTSAAVCTFSAAAQVTGFTDRATGTDYAVPGAVASVNQGGKRLPATALTATPAKLTPGQTARVVLAFGEGGRRPYCECGPGSGTSPWRCPPSAARTSRN